MSFTASLTAPIEIYLHNAASTGQQLGCLAANISSGCVEPLYPGQGCPDYLLPAYYVVKPAKSIEYRDAIDSNSTIAVEYSGTLEAQVRGGASTHTHRFRILSAATREGDCVFNRDFARLAIIYGLEHNEIGFPGFSWTNGCKILTTSKTTFDDKHSIYLCTGSLLISLSKNASNCR